MRENLITNFRANLYLTLTKYTVKIYYKFGDQVNKYNTQREDINYA